MKDVKKWNWDQTVAAVLLGGSILTTVVFAVISNKRTLTGLEATLLQGFSLIAGLIGSFVFGRQSATAVAREIIKPHAKSAFRRLVSLYQSLSRVASVIEASQKSSCPEEQRIALAKLEAIVVEQLATADDALEDWHDVVPEDVEELYKKLRSGKGGGKQ